MGRTAHDDWIERERERVAEEYDRQFSARLEDDPERAVLESDWHRKPSRKEYQRKGPKRVCDVQKLWGRQHTALDLIAAGMSNKEAGEVVGLSQSRVSVLRHSTPGQQKLAALSAIRNQESIDVIKEVTRMLPKALAVYEEVLDSEETTVNQKLRVADTLVMKIGGHAAPTRMDVRSVNFKAEDLHELRERGMRAARESGLIAGAAQEESE